MVSVVPIPCIFMGKLDRINMLYLGLYVNDLCHFSASDSCERIFEEKLVALTNVDFMGDVSFFLRIKFSWSMDEQGNLSAHLSQQAFVEQIITNNKLH